MSSGGDGDLLEAAVRDIRSHCPLGPWIVTADELDRMLTVPIPEMQQLTATQLRPDN